MVVSWSCHSLWLEQWEGAPAERIVRITSAPPAWHTSSVRLSRGGNFYLGINSYIIVCMALIKYYLYLVDGSF